MSFQRVIVSAFIALGMLGASQATAQNLSVNPGFETGDFTGWTEFLSPDASIVSDDPFEGTYNAKIDNQNDAGVSAIMKNANIGVGQVSPGEEVTVSFWARGSAGAGGVHFAELFSELDGGGTSKTEILGGGPLFPASATEWEKFEFTTTLGPDVSGGVTVQFNAATGANAGSFSVLEIDNVVVTPEPASLGLLGLGGLGLLTRRRRH